VGKGTKKEWREHRCSFYGLKYSRQGIQGKSILIRTAVTTAVNAIGSNGLPAEASEKSIKKARHGLWNRGKKI
jgi:hypothetical protein